MREAEKRNAERCNDHLAPLDLQPCSGTSLEAALMAAVVCNWKGKPVGFGELQRALESVVQRPGGV